MDSSPEAPRRFLFVMWEGGGNVPPQLALARRLALRGHSVRVLADPSIRGDAEAAGCEFVPFTRAPHRVDRSSATDYIRDHEARTPVGAFARIRDRVMFGPAMAYAQDTLEELERAPADAVAVDLNLLGAAAAAEKAGLPFAILNHTLYLLPRPGVPASGPGFAPARGPLGRLRDAVFGGVFVRIFESGLPALNEARARLGLEPVRTLPAVLERADRLLILASPAFDYGEHGLPPNARYVGAQLDDPAWAGPWTSPWEPAHPDPLVVVSLSTTDQAQTGLLQRVADALGGLPARGLVTTGHAVDPAAIRARANVVVLRSAPHAQVFREAAAVVTHAGHGTTMRALASGLPLVCVPMGRDQADVAARAVHLGAALRASPRASAAKLRDAVRRVLEEPRFREAARRISRTIAAETAEERGVRELEALAGARAAARDVPAHA